MTITLEEERLYPFILPTDGWYGASEIPPGWHDDIIRMCDQIRKFLLERRIPLDNYQCLQGKEKWGRLEWYDSFKGSPEIHQEIHNRFINPCKLLVNGKCVVCGKPGTLRRKTWIEVLCDDCYKPKENGKN